MEINVNIKKLEDIDTDDISLVGGKGISLARMTHSGIFVPSGFVVTTKVYENYFSKPIPDDIQDEIFQAFDSLKTERVAVRSSAVAEDSKTFSWAGQLETYLNISKENLIESINKCWASMHSERANAYAKKQGLKNNQQIGVIVQKMINSEISGVIFTLNPVTKNKDEVMIEAIYGLGELLAQGMVTPYNYIIDKNSLEIKSSTKGEQKTMLVYQNGNNKEIPLAIDLQNSEILSINDVRQLVELASRIEDIYKYPQDIEWAKESDKFYIVQSRPVTNI